MTLCLLLAAPAWSAGAALFLAAQGNFRPPRFGA